MVILYALWTGDPPAVSATFKAGTPTHAAQRQTRLRHSAGISPAFPSISCCYPQPPRTSPNCYDNPVTQEDTKTDRKASKKQQLPLKTDRRRFDTAPVLRHARRGRTTSLNKELMLQTGFSTSFRMEEASLKPARRMNSSIVSPSTRAAPSISARSSGMIGQATHVTELKSIATDNG